MLKRFKTFLSFLREQSGYQEKRITIDASVYQIREVFPNDIKALMRVQQLVYKDYQPWHRGAFLSELYSLDSHRYLCIVSNNQIIGFIGIRVVATDAHITNIAVIPDYQNQGLGNYLLMEAEKFAHQYACQTMSLEVRISNVDAQRLYTKLGYTTRQVLTEYYSEGKEDALDMVKELK